MKYLTDNVFFRSPSAPLESTPNPESFNTPITRKKRFVPKRCSFGSNNRLSINTSLPLHSSPNRTPDLSAVRNVTPDARIAKKLCTPDVSSVTPDIRNADVSDMSCDRSDNFEASEAPSHYQDGEVSFGEASESSEPHNPSEPPHSTTSDSSMMGGGMNTSQVSKVIGTPDYIAPELLLRRPHTTAADWWSFGICMYELIVGLPPFHDSCVTAIFKNILNSEIEWPEDISPAAQSCILALLKFDPKDRASFQDIKYHAFFKDIDWDNILFKEMPFVPKPENDTDTGYFEGHNSAFNIRLSDFDGVVMEEEEGEG